MSGFEASSEYFNFQDFGHWATPGNIFADDYGTDSSQVGRIILDAKEDRMIELLALDVSGWSIFSETSELHVFVDREMAYQEVSAMSGQVDFANLDFEGISGGVIEIDLENLVSVGVGLDNILISTTAVPAPGAIALLGVAGLVGGRRRRTARHPSGSEFSKAADSQESATFSWLVPQGNKGGLSRTVIPFERGWAGSGSFLRPLPPPDAG